MSGRRYEASEIHIPMFAGTSLDTAPYCLPDLPRLRYHQTIMPERAAEVPSRSALPSKATIGLVQMSCTREKEPNVRKAVARIAEAAAAGAQIVCLQELFAGEYFCQSEDHARFAEAEPIPGPTSEALSAAAREHGVV
ncbi:MAG: nitrilase-related carbon-nitrogen hydrolase, partial [Pirellulales bacterium]